MAYTNAERATGKVMFEAMTANGSSSTIWTESGDFTVGGTFVGTVTLEQKTFGDDSTEGEWVAADTALTTKGTKRYEFGRARPVRATVSGYTSGTINVYIEPAVSV